MGFGKEGWEVPHEFIQPFIDHDGGNAFMFEHDEDTVIDFCSEDERLNIQHLCANIHDFVDDESLDEMISITKWWKVESRPRKSRSQSFLAGMH
eukprot:2059416-Karenia_brevis.AAC.1